MRLITRIAATLGAVSLVSASVTDYCTDLCNQDPNCNHERGSHCKVEHNPATCFSYYFVSPDKSGPYVYRAPSDSGSEDTPVLCSDAQDILNRGETTTADAPTTVDTTDYCKLLCVVDAVCDPLARGSYLKSWENPQVCYAFYLTDATGTAYYYFNGSGDESFPMSNAQAREFYNALSNQSE